MRNSKQTIEDINNILPLSYDSLYEEYSSFELGKVLGHGCFSLALRLDEKYFFKELIKTFSSPVMIITLEKEKEAIIRSFMGVISVNEEIEELIPGLSEFKDAGFNIFFMEECKKFSDEALLQSSIIVKDLGVFENISDFYHDFSTGYELEDINEAINNSRFKINHKNSNEDFFLDVFNCLKMIERDIQKVSKLFKDTYLRLDIHERQFLKYKGKTLCVDPFIILNKN